MIRQTDNCAHANRWSRSAGPAALFCLGLLACALCTPARIGGPLVLVVTTATALGCARVPAKRYFVALAMPMGFISVGALALAFSLNLNEVPMLRFSKVNGLIALDTSLRAIAGASTLVLFAHAIPFSQLLRLLRLAWIPESILDLMCLCYRNLFVLDDVREKLIRAQNNRLGYATFRSSLSSGAQAGAALFSRSIDRAVRMERGLAARCYDGNFRVLDPKNEARPSHWVFAALIPLIVALLATALAAYFIV